MVCYSEEAKKDLRNILWGLANWKKHPLGYDHAERYVDDLADEIDAICTRSFHRNCIYNAHKKHGEKVYRYNRSKTTQWNVIYNWDKENRIAYVNKIMNNHLTVSGLSS